MAARSRLQPRVPSLRSELGTIVCIALGVMAVVAVFVVSSVLAVVPIWPPVPAPGSCAPGTASVEFGLASPSGSTPYPTVSTDGSSWWYNFSFVHCFPTGVNASWIAFETVGANCSAAAGVHAYQLMDSARHPIAVENGSSLAWSGNLSSPLPSAGFLTETSSGDLSGDLLLIFMEGWVEWSPFDAGGLAGRC